MPKLPQCRGWLVHRGDAIAVEVLAVMSYKVTNDQQKASTTCLKEVPRLQSPQLQPPACGMELEWEGARDGHAESRGERGREEPWLIRSGSRNGRVSLS